MQCRIDNCQDCDNSNWLCTSCKDGLRLVNYTSRFGDIYQLCQSKSLYCQKTDPATSECLQCKPGTDLVLGSQGTVCKNMPAKGFQFGLIFFLVIATVSISGVAYVFLENWFRKRKKQKIFEKATTGKFKNLNKDADKNKSGRLGKPPSIVLPDIGYPRNQILGNEVGSAVISVDNSPHNRGSYTAFEQGRFPGGPMDTPVKQHLARPSKNSGTGVSRPNLLMLYSVNEGDNKMKDS